MLLLAILPQFVGSNRLHKKLISKYVFVLVSLAVFVILNLSCAISYHITERYTFTATGDVVELYLGILVPKDGPYQEVKNFKVSGCDTVEIESRNYIDIIKLSGMVSKNQPTEMLATYDVRLNKKGTKWQAPVEMAQLNPQDEIESDHPKLRECANQLVSGNSKKDVYKIYTFVGKHIREPKGSRVNAGPPSALKAYETGIGVCGECANLMTALCRAAGIPSRSMTGLAFIGPITPFFSSTKKWSHPAISHAWVEYHTDRGWEMADPTFAMYAPLRRLFFIAPRPDLSYGERESCQKAFTEVTEWCISRGEIIGSMSAPMHFCAAATTKTVSLTPSVTVKKRWTNP